MAIAGWLAGGLLLLGVALTWLGLRGRRVDDHPLCERCGRDLYGLDLYGPDSPINCPECGRLLLLARIRTGNRERRPRLIGVGTLLSTPGLLLFGSIALLAMAGVDVQHHKPVWLLRWEDSPAAVYELDRRDQAGLLPAVTRAELVAAYLDDQADRDKAWTGAKGDYLIRLMLLRALTPIQVQRFFDQGYAGLVHARPRISQNGTLVVDVNGKPRLGRTFHVPTEGFCILQHNELLYAGWNTGFSLTDTRFASTGTIVLDSLQPGEYGIGLRSSRTLPGNPAFRPDGLNHDALPFGWLVTPQPTLATALATFEVLPEGQSSVELVQDKHLLDRVRRGIRLRDASSNENEINAFSVTRRVDDDNEHRWRLTWDLTALADGPPLPVALAYDVIFRDESGREFRVGEGKVLWMPSLLEPSRLVVEAGKIPSHRINRRGDLPPNFEAETVDVILRPSPEAAEATIDITRILDGEIVIPNVRVRWLGE